GSWLYGVAHQTARKARATAVKRRAREKQVPQLPEPEGAQPGQPGDLQPLLDRELSRLPDRYRVALVLCDLEGKTRPEVARQLGLPEGTVASRLARARATLARRLARYGPPAAVLLPGAAPASVSAALLSSTIKLASRDADIPAGVAALTDGVLKAMLLT